MRAAGAPRRAGRWSPEPSSSFSSPFLLSHALSPLTLHFCLSALAGPLSPAPFSGRDASRKGRATPRCCFPHLCGAVGLPAPPPVPHRPPRPPRDPAPAPPRRTLKVLGSPGTPRPPPYSASDSSGPRRLRAWPDPPLLTINLDFTGRLRVPLRPLAPPLPAFPRDGAGLCQPPPLRSGSLRRVRSSSTLHRTLPSPPLS